MQSNYADVILDITHANVDRPFTYAVPEEMRDTIRPGMPVKLPFGSGNRVRTGWVIALYEAAPEVPWELKEILGPAEKQVSAESSLIALALWMHEHYGCMLSQALKTVMPVKSRVKKRKTKTPSSLPGDSRGEAPEGTAERHHVILNEEQAEAVRQFREDRAAGRRSTFLLFGITGSGKTEVYAEMIREVLGKGQQAILLIPEISLTFQTVRRLEGIFGERVAIIHSRLTQGERYEQLIESRGGIDLQVLGIGQNAHIGFNEPDLKFAATTHKVELDEETIQANSRFFKSAAEVPRYAISMGIKTIMLARRVILLASGAAKAEAVSKTLCGSVTPKAPASILQLHQDVTIILDKEAAALLPKEIYGVRIDNYS